MFYPMQRARVTDVTMTMTWSLKPTGKLKFQPSTHKLQLGSKFEADSDAAV
jgi:hypothetical protein